MELKNLKKGTEVLLVKHDSRISLIDQKTVLTKVISVGRKYFKIEADPINQYRLEDGVIKTDFGGLHKNTVYVNIQEYQNHIRKQVLVSELQNFFRYQFNAKNLSLEQIEKVAEILGIETSNQ